MAAFTLNDKPLYFGLGIGAGVAVLLLVLVHFLMIEGMNEQITTMEGQIAELDKKIEQGRTAEKKLQQFRAEIDRLQQELEKLRRILPSTKNTEEIIQKIKALVDQGGFVLNRMTFPKLGSPSSDPYIEWPIVISVDGRYHELAMLYNRLGNYSRIINVENINVKALPVQFDRTINAEFTAKTFVYAEPVEADTKSKKSKPKPGGESKGEGE